MDINNGEVNKKVIDDFLACGPIWEKEKASIEELDRHYSLGLYGKQTYYDMKSCSDLFYYLPKFQDESESISGQGWEYIFNVDDCKEYYNKVVNGINCFHDYKKRIVDSVNEKIENKLANKKSSLLNSEIEKRSIIFGLVAAIISIVILIVVVKLVPATNYFYTVFFERTPIAIGEEYANNAKDFVPVAIMVAATQAILLYGLCVVLPLLIVSVPTYFIVHFIFKVILENKSHKLSLKTRGAGYSKKLCSSDNIAVIFERLPVLTAVVMRIMDEVTEKERQIERPPTYDREALRRIRYYKIYGMARDDREAMILYEQEKREERYYKTQEERLEKIEEIAKELRNQASKQNLIAAAWAVNAINKSNELIDTENKKLDELKEIHKKLDEFDD